MHTAGVNVVSRDVIGRTVGGGVRTLTRTRTGSGYVNDGEGAIWGSQVAVVHAIRINGHPRNDPYRVDAETQRPLARACACAGDVERGDGAVLTYEAVIHIVRVHVQTQAHRLRADTHRKRTLKGT